MSIATVVVDTSALLDSADALHPSWGAALEHLETSYQAIAPRILVSEASNVVHHKRPREFGASAAERSDLVEALLAGVDIVDDDAAARRRCGAVVEQEGLSFCDAEFLELALRDNTTMLLTQDKPLLAAAKSRLGRSLALSLDEAARAVASGKL
jgi:predicted nucleic acid-binding protein